MRTSLEFFVSFESLRLPRSLYGFRRSTTMHTRISTLEQLRMISTHVHFFYRGSLLTVVHRRRRLLDTAHSTHNETTTNASRVPYSFLKVQRRKYDVSAYA